MKPPYMKSPQKLKTLSIVTDSSKAMYLFNYQYDFYQSIKNKNTLFQQQKTHHIRK